MKRPILSRLEMFFTNRCNLDCSYCFSKTMTHRRARVSLGPSELRRAVDLFAASREPGRDPSDRRVIIFIGGEPFLEFETVSKTVDHILGKTEPFEICVATNGTLLDRSRLEWLQERDVNVAISLDGGKSVNDANRRFRADPGRSVFDAVAAGLRRLPAPLVKYLHGMVTLTTRTAPRIVDSMDALLALGLGHLDVSFDFHEVWTPAKLSRVRKALRGLRKYCIGRFSERRLCSQEGYGFDVTFMQDFGAKDDSALHSLYLSPEGTFSPCSTLCTAGKAEYSVGDLDAGIDFDRLVRVHAEAVRFMASHGRPETASPPIDRYFYAKLNGLDPAVMLRGVDELGAVLDEELGPLFATERAIRTHKRYGLFDRFDRAPERRSCDELPFLRIPVGSGRPSEFAGLRQDVDYCLYSKGRDKEILLAPADPKACFPAVEGIALYALLKAKTLKKRLRLRLQADASSFSEEQRRFLRNHAIGRDRGSGFLAGVP